jgi:hypothetical protein
VSLSKLDQLQLVPSGGDTGPLYTSSVGLHLFWSIMVQSKTRNEHGSGTQIAERESKFNIYANLQFCSIGRSNQSHLRFPLKRQIYAVQYRYLILIYSWYYLPPMCLLLIGNIIIFRAALPEQNISLCRVPFVIRQLLNNQGIHIDPKAVFMLSYWDPHRKLGAKILQNCYKMILILKRNWQV